MTDLSVAARPLPVIEAELDLLEKDTQQKELSLFENYIEVGRRLEEVKAQLAHGEWGPWLENRGYSQVKAVKLMKVFRAYGKEQQSLFGGEAKSQAFANLGFQKLVQLLVIEDDEEREQFVAENHVEAMSTRELEKALKEREMALEEAAEAREELRGFQLKADRLQEDWAEQKRVYEAKLTAAGVETEQAKASAKTAEEARNKMAEDMKITKASLKDLRQQQADVKKYQDETETLRSELEQLRNRPVDVAVQVREPTPEELQAMTAEAVEQARTQDAKLIQELKKQLAATDQAVVAFTAAFRAWQTAYRNMEDIRQDIAKSDGDKAAKLGNAVQAELKKQMGGNT